MPDISILINLAEFYNVGIPEIIDGERKGEKMNEEVKETVLKLSNYAETINQKIKIKLFWLTIAALLGMIAFLVNEKLDMNLTLINIRRCPQTIRCRTRWSRYH